MSNTIVLDYSSLPPYAKVVPYNPHMEGTDKDGDTVVTNWSTYVPDNVELLHDVVMGTGGTQPLHAEVSLPKVLPKEPMPVVLTFHRSGDTHKNTILARLIASRGYFTASCEYRQNRWPDRLEDGKLAVRWIRANAEKYHVDPNKIGVLGDSAGGWIACALGTMHHPEFEGSGGYAGVSSKVQAVVDVCGFPDLSKQLSYGLGGSTEEEKLALHLKASPIRYIDSQTPPFLVIHGDKDTTVPIVQSIEFSAALNAAKVPVKFLIVKGGQHNITTLQTDIRTEIFAFFDHYLVKPQAVFR